MGVAPVRVFHLLHFQTSMKVDYFRIQAFWLKILERSGPSHSREQAFEHFMTTWLQAAIEAGAESDYQSFVRSRRLIPEHGWFNLQGNPCWWDSSAAPVTRIYLHDNGGLVVQLLKTEGREILFASAGASARSAVLQPFG